MKSHLSGDVMPWGSPHSLVSKGYVINLCDYIMTVIPHGGKAAHITVYLASNTSNADIKKINHPYSTHHIMSVIIYLLSRHEGLDSK